jgi:hypothetical protein
LGTPAPPFPKEPRLQKANQCGSPLHPLVHIGKAATVKAAPTLLRTGGFFLYGNWTVPGWFCGDPLLHLFRGESTVSDPGNF